MLTPPMGVPFAGRHPLLWAALAFAAGIWLGVRAWRPPLWWMVAAVVLAAAAVYWLRERVPVAAAGALLVVALLGALAVQLGDAARRQADLSAFLDHEVTISGHVVRDSLARPPRFGRPRQSVDVETEAITVSGATQAARFAVRVGLYAASASDDEALRAPPLPALRYGQRVRFPARLRLPRSFGNPGALDVHEYLAAQGVVATASVRADRLELLPGRGGTRLGRIRHALRRSLLEHMAGLWAPEDAALLAAMLAGQRTFLDRDTRQDFQRTGTYHILVVSGMNVGILAVLVFWVLRRLHAGEFTTTLVTFAVTGAYAYLTDAGPPILRATLMLWIYLGARLLYRARSPLNALGVAAVAILVAEPRALFDASFQLTFLSVLAIAGIGMPLLERTSQPYRRALWYLDSVPYDLSLEPRLAQFRLDLRLLAERLARLAGRRLAGWIMVGSARATLALHDVLVIAALMQVALAVPMAVYFHRAAMLALPANAVVVPLTGLLMPAAVLATALSYLSATLALLPAAATALVLHMITGVVRLLGGLRAADLRVANPEDGIVAVSFLALAASMVLVRRRGSWPWPASWRWPCRRYGWRSSHPHRRCAPACWR